MNMKMTIKIALILNLFIVSSTAQTVENELEYFFTTLARNNHFNGNVLISEYGKIIYEKSFGFADFENNKVNTSKSRFPIASITKTFTATAILQLVEKGKLKVKDPVIKYLPEFPYPAITIRHLLSHTSGLQPYDNFFDSLRIAHPDTVFTNKDILPRYAALKLPLLYRPGDYGNYDNVNYIFLALIVEKVSGIPFHDYLKRFILQPAGMENTFCPKIVFYHYTPEERKGLSLTYWYPHLYSNTIERTDTIQFVSKYWGAYNFEGFGEIVSTTEDLLKYDQALNNGKLLADTILQKAFIPVALNNGSSNPVGNGLGWKIGKDTSYGKIVWHGGGMIGLRSTLLRNVTKHQTIILIDNTQNETDDIAKDALKILNGVNVKPYGKSAARIFAKELINNGIKAAENTLSKLLKDTVNYSVNENEFNDLGYDLMNQNKLIEALETLKVNTQLFPRSWNVYDSYGEALLKNNQKQEATEMYKKSIELNPDNQHGKKILESIFK
jgi:CubicO group peptidase (beta-lactamase class C family)